MTVTSTNCANYFKLPKLQTLQNNFIHNVKDKN